MAEEFADSGILLDSQLALMDLGEEDFPPPPPPPPPPLAHL